MNCILFPLFYYEIRNPNLEQNSYYAYQYLPVFVSCKKIENKMKAIAIQNNIGLPKYKQIINAIEKAIESQDLKKDDKLPSINKICLPYNLSRDTALQA